MKKIIVFLLTAVLCLTTIAVATSAAVTENPDLYAKIYTIAKFTPKVDGELDPEYNYSDVVNLRDNGDEFAKGQIYYLWDDEKLYFFVNIQDTTPSNPELAISHEADCIEMLFSLYNFDVNATNIPSKRPDDIGDAQFRVFRDKVISKCTNIVDNGITYADGSHGGFGKWVYENTADLQAGTVNDASYIIHWSDNSKGYGFEGFVRWSDDLLGKTEAYPEATIKDDVVVGLGIQVNDDNNGDNKREMKCYAENSGPNSWSMSGNRATCGKFRLAPAFDDPDLGDTSIIFAVASVISAGGFTLFATKKAKKD